MFEREGHFNRNLKKNRNKDQLIENLGKLADESVVQEFYRCVMKHLEGKKDDERHECGGVSIAEACLLYLYYLKSGCTCKQIEEKFGLPHNSAKNLMHQMTHWVRNLN